jgi:hypothetical protein
MRMLMGSSKKHLDDTQTMIVVGINRLREEYDLGKADQMKDEHWRKQVRIAIAGGVTGLGLLGSLFGVEGSPYVALFINFLVHVAL